VAIALVRLHCYFFLSLSTGALSSYLCFFPRYAICTGFPIAPPPTFCDPSLFSLSRVERPPNPQPPTLLLNRSVRQVPVIRPPLVPSFSSHHRPPFLNKLVSDSQVKSRPHLSQYRYRDFPPGPAKSEASRRSPPLFRAVVSRPC